MSQKKIEKESRCRDAVMLYVVRKLKINGQELAFMTRVVYSETFLVALKCIRLESKIEDHQFYNLEILSGIKPIPEEDKETLGGKLVEWVHQTLEGYREPME